MADAYTQFLNLVKPEVGASRDMWGDKGNTNYDTIDAWAKAADARITDISGKYMPKSGGAFTGSVSVTGALIFGAGLAGSKPWSQFNFSDGSFYLQADGGAAGAARFTPDGDLILTKVGGAVSTAIANAASTGAAALAAAVKKVGDVMTGDLEIGKVSPGLVLSYPGVKRGRFGVGADARLRWSDQNGAEHFSIGPSGEIYTQQLGDLNNRIESRAASFADDRRNNSVVSMRFVFAGDLYNSWNANAAFNSPFGGYACIVDRTTFYELDGTWNVGQFRWRFLQMLIPNQGWVTVGAAA